ncbi:MAG: hypothetical protein MI861_16995, partial [Pirellulales bacterium]|nr:hypothetical protein [Pirellulales bacterium]
VAFERGRGQTGIVNLNGEEVVRIEGNESVALLPQVSMSDGVIEVEISSDTFSGIAFRAADTENYELIYFRPQNSGTAKHENSVQYVSKGVAGADWATLRRQFPGKYEAGADMKVDNWFAARVEIEGEAARVFVNDEQQPALVVKPLLGKRNAGGLGIWGWNTHFRNFSFTPKR